MSRANFVQVQLAQAATDTQNTLSVKAPDGGFVLPPSDGGRLVLTDSPGRPMAFEVISYTGRTGAGPYTLTGVVRGLEGTAGLGWSVDAYVMQALTTGELDDLLAAKLGTGGVAASATKLATARTIGGVSFDGTASIDLPGVNAAGTQATTGNAATATALQTARTINGVSFDGTANITVADATKQTSHANLTALSGLAGVADRLPYFTGAGALSLATLTSLARTLLDDTTQSGMQSTLGLVKQTSATDTTAGALMAVGAFGLGPDGGAWKTVDANNLILSTGFTNVDPASANLPIANYGVLLSLITPDTYRHQIFYSVNTTDSYQRAQVAGVWQPWRKQYTQGNILGTVSQSGGVPTGAIIERGSNANGEYVRWADGTQICTFNEPSAPIPNVADGSIFRSNSKIWTYPAAFIAGPSVSGGVRSSVWWLNVTLYTLTTSAVMFAYSAVSGTGEVAADLSAIGRWY